MITIRDYTPSDASVLQRLFFETVRRVNLCDYSQAQAEAWAPEQFDRLAWETLMADLSPFVAEIEGVIVGYADLQPSGLIDHFFCHHQYQQQGVGRALMNHLLRVGKQRGIARLHSEVSITARPFYEHFGFTVTQTQQVEMRGQTLTNFVMERCS